MYCFSICSSIDSILFGDAKAEFPSKPIKVYVGFKPGGRTDLIARMVAKHITDNKMLSQPIVIVNKPGAAAANAARAVMAAKPDGHTILHWSHQMLIANAMSVNKIHRTILLQSAILVVVVLYGQYVMMPHLTL